MVIILLGIKHPLCCSDMDSSCHNLARSRAASIYFVALQYDVFKLSCGCLPESGFNLIALDSSIACIGGTDSGALEEAAAA